MPHDVLLDYLKEVEKAIGHLPDVYVELYEEEFLANERVNLRIRVRFYNGCLLQLNEAVIFQTKLEHLGYRYHFQRNQSTTPKSSSPTWPAGPEAGPLRMI